MVKKIKCNEIIFDFDKTISSRSEEFSAKRRRINKNVRDSKDKEIREIKRIF